MTTLLTAILYLWLALTILLAVMWFLREQDRRHKDQRQNELEDELLNGSQQPAPTAAAQQDTASEQQDTASEQQDTAQVQQETAPARDETATEQDEPAQEITATEQEEPADLAAETQAAEPEPGAETPPAEVEPLPWSKNTKKRKKKSSQRNRSKSSQKVTAVAEEPVDEAPVPEPKTAEGGDSTDTATVVAGGIVDLLDGVTLPFDLTPLTARIEDPDRHVIFISTHPDAAEVGTAFADELVQQGFEIEAAGFDQALATRGEDTISMRISPDAGTVTDGSAQRYPSAGEHDVAIEVWVGNGSPPPLTD